jgi:hypothetical protein
MEPVCHSGGGERLKNDKNLGFLTCLLMKLYTMKDDHRGEGATDKVIELVITVVIAAVLYAALLVTYLGDLQDPNSTMYAGSTAAPIVGIISIFYWLGVALLAVGMVKMGPKA